MKVLFDTNVWLDVILGRPDFSDVSLTALYECIDAGDDICFVATSLKDVFYLVSRAESTEAAYESVERMMDLGHAVTVDGSVCRLALPLERPDYEDGIIAAAALADNVDLIVTRDEDAFDDLGIDRLSPVQFIKKRGHEIIAV